MLSSAGKHGELYAIIGISKYSGVLNKSIGLYAEGHNPEGSSTTHSISIENSMKMFIKMDYMNIENDIVMLTDKGKGFANYLIEKGFVCDVFNGRVVTEGFKSFLEKLKTKDV